MIVLFAPFVQRKINRHMHRYRVHTWLWLLFAGFFLMTFGATARAQSATWEETLPAIELAVEKALVEGQIPSIAIALVKGDEVIWSNGYGYANLWARTPAVSSTVYLIGSTFKAMSTVALLQQMEAGQFSLDEPVRDYLSLLRIRNEVEDEPVTFRHLLTHTSGLPADFGAFPVWGDDVPPPIERYLGSALRAESAPLSGQVYSNMAYTLTGYLVQKFSGTPFKEHIQNVVFEPLEMTSTAFAPTPEMTERLAIPYIVDSNTKRLVPTEQLKAQVWPAGIVYGTVLDQANWLIANLNGGVFKGRHLLKEESITQMHSLQYDKFKGPISNLWGGEEAGYGLTWWTDIRKGERYFAHSGSVPGYTAFLQGNKDQKLGVALLSNGNRAHPYLIKLTDTIMELMRDLAIPEAVVSDN